MGQSYLAQISKEQIPVFNVTFEPGCRNNWHIHNAKSDGGQMLICVGGRGWYQEEGKNAVELLPGSVVNIPVGVKHWHGAAKDSWFSHLALEIPGEKGSTNWCESVSEEDYKKTDIYEGQVMITRENISSIEKFQVEGRALRQAIIDKYEE